MFGIGTGELIILALVAVLLFGKDDLHSTLRKVMNGWSELKKMTSEAQSSWNEVKTHVRREIVEFEHQVKESLPTEQEIADSLPTEAELKSKLALEEPTSVPHPDSAPNADTAPGPESDLPATAQNLPKPLPAADPLPNTAPQPALGSEGAWSQKLPPYSAPLHQGVARGQPLEPENGELTKTS